MFNTLADLSVAFHVALDRARSKRGSAQEQEWLDTAWRIWKEMDRRWFGYLVQNRV